MPGLPPRSTAPARRGRAPQAVPAPRQTIQPTIETPPPSEPLLFTVAQAAQRLGISRSLLYELLATGDIESITIGRLRRIPADALATYIQTQRTKNRIPQT